MVIIIVLVLLALATAVAFFMTVFLRGSGKIIAAAVGSVLLVTTILTWFGNSYTQVSTGHGAIAASFGKIDLNRPVLTEGLNWVKPWESVYELSHQQQTFDRNIDDGTDVIVQARDSIPMSVDVSFHWVLNYEAMGWIRQQYGANYASTLVIPSAASAIREAASHFADWDDLMNKREEFRSLITEAFEAAVIEKMRTKRLPEDIVAVAFDFPTVDLRRVLPVNEGLTREISLTKEAVQQGLRKQTEIANAALDARKRGQDGTAIRDTILRVLFETDSEGALPEDAEIPPGTTIEEVSHFIYAIAAIKKADAVEIAAQRGNLTVMVTDSGATSLPLPSKEDSSSTTATAEVVD